MSVASLELCKELYELSGWDDTDYINQLQFDDDTPTKKRIVVLREDHSCSSHDHKPFPAYDLGYLMRKLPEIRLETWHNGHVVIKHYTSNGVPDKLERLGKVVIAEADTPEDAACKLAIELFKQGVLNAVV